MAELVLNFVTPIIENAVSKAISLAAAQISKAWGLEKELRELTQTLTMIQGLLQDAEGRQESNPAIWNWLQQLRDVAYDAMDVLDEYGYEVLKHKVQTQRRKRKQVRTFFALFNPIAFRLSMADNIRKINRTLVKINNHGVSDLLIKFSDQSHSTAGARPYPRTDSILDCLKFVGRDNDVLEIVNKLENIRSQHLLSGISIVGLGGIGKTTLAKSICSMVKEQKLYDLVAWVCVSEEFDEKTILGDMLEYLDGFAGQMNNIDALIQKPGQKLENRKFLLVLDDMWNDDRDKWDSFKSCLLKILKTSGNSILVTTRSDTVASIMEAPPMQKHDMLKLSDHECWLIIEVVVLRSSTETSIPLDLVGIGQEIAKKCGGLPLVASVIGGALSHEMKIDKWQEILDDEAWILQDENKKILSILKISFDCFPSSLKTCFSYCSIFPKDAVIFKDDLIQLWMAQGFLHNSNGSLVEMEDIGNEYFNQLLSNSLLQDIKWDLYGNIESCKMHDVLHDLALLVSKDVDVFCSMASDLKSLQSMKLMAVQNKKLSTFLGKLKHLKYLDISRAYVTVAPKTFSKLYNLQTSKFLDCGPNGIANLISWRHIYSIHPHDISIMQLTSLRTLSHFVVGTKKGCQIENLGCLSQLGGKLGILKLEHVRSKLEASKANLKEKTKLHQLTLHWSSGNERAVNNNNDEEVLKGLQPHSTLKSLSINGYKGKMFPSWMGNDINSSGPSFLLYNMVELQLINCDKCTCIPSLGLLPSLKVLCIERMENVRRMGHKLQLGGVESIRLFPALKTLVVCDMERLEEWVEVVEDAAIGSQGVIVFPCLEKLLIFECPLLKTWSMGGFSSHHKLSELLIEHCLSLTTIPSLDGLSALEKLELFSYDGLTSLPIGLGSCISLQLLEINGCQNLNSIPSINGLTSLERLNLICCHGLTCLPIGLDSCISLQLLKIFQCQNLNSILSMNGLTYLERLYLTRCDGLTCLPIGLDSCISLQQLAIRSCPNLISIPEDIRKLHSLDVLRIIECENLRSISGEWLASLTCLKGLHLGHFWSELEDFPRLTSIHKLHTSLEKLELYEWDTLESLPHQLQHLTALKELTLLKFNGLEALPERLGDLSSLHRLVIWSCPNLTHLPSIEAMRRLSNLQYLGIRHCPKLKKS
ncbi:hypothetical protein SLEP1_g55594 [Rubroshorea leprosula]|uniref:Uncharacterized protein n=1 Tax=Rubroshorea leprosula TaxID=152421 RepID=A0AAV5MJP5_9ROSI|nr:hypothetical protein SLEP1_g55594 [Rubroshorea leprosula]